MSCLKSFCIEGFLLLTLVIHFSNAFDFQCPSSQHWVIRGKSQCLKNNPDKMYICLFDDNNNRYKEICRNKHYYKREGYKFVIKLQPDQQKCETTRFQPFRFSTNGSTFCVLEKTNCGDEGQIIFNNGSTSSDRQCRCDYTRGYNFITKPKHRCYCLPSIEDCSCYQKHCQQGFILSPDYQCINLTSWHSQFTCDVIRPNTQKDINFLSYDNHSEDNSVTPERKGKIVLSIVIGLTIVVTLIIVHTTSFYLPKMESIRHDKKILRENKELRGRLAGQVIPQHIRDQQTKEKQLWGKTFSKFVETKAFYALRKSIQNEQCILISGSMGCGKSSTAFHIAMAFEETMDCEFMIISNPDDLYKYAHEDEKQLFLIDDVFGKYSVNDFHSMWWNHHGESIQNILNKNKDLKLIMTSRLHIFLTVNPIQPTFCHLDFTSEDLVLTLVERKMIGKCYLRDSIIDDIGQDVIMSNSFFPALCTNVRAENKENIIKYFTLPVSYISYETINMRTSGDLFYLALTILLIFNNKVKKYFFNEGCREVDDMLQFLSKEIGFDGQPSKPLLFSRFIALKRSYVLENSEYFECLHINLFNALVLSIGPCIVRALIVYGESSFLNERTCLETSGEDYPNLKIVIPKELQDLYFDRMLSDMKFGTYDFYKGHQQSSVGFRKLVIAYLNKYLNKDHLKRGKYELVKRKTVLHVVSAEGFADYVEFFLGLEKTLVNLEDKYGQTALQKACMHGHTHVAKILLDNCASIDLEDKNTETALYIACKNNKIETVKYLLSSGANIKHKNCDLQSPLHIACLNGNTDIAKLLLERKAKVNDQDKYSHTPLHLACKNRHVDVVKLLVQYKPDPNLVDKENKTAIYIAAEQEDINIVRCVLDLRPKLDKPTDWGRVALHCASENGSTDIAKLLVEHQADINIDDTAGFTPLYIACKNGHLEIVKLLLHSNVILRNERRNTPLFIACEKGDREIVKLLLENKCDPNCKNSDGMSSLHKACDNEETDIVSLLIEYGALINEPDANLQTPLFRACLKGSYNVADELLKSGASVNQPNISELTPLHVACIDKREDIVMLLLNSNADIEKDDKRGVTPLELAYKSGNKCILDALLLKQHDKQTSHNVSK